MTDIVETRLNGTPYSATSCSWNIALAPFVGITALEYEQKRERTVVHGSKKSAIPLGITDGKYEISTLSITMLRSSYQRLIEILTVMGLGSYGNAVFDVVATYSDVFVLLKGIPPIVVVIQGCRITGEKDGYQEGIDELVTEIDLKAVALTRNGLQLWADSFDPLDAFTPYQDYIVLGGATSPGVAVIKGAGSPRKWDVRDGYGLTGATTVFMGESLSSFDVDIFCWKPEHFLAWQLFATAVLMSLPLGGRPTSMSIQHPTLNNPALSITQVVVTNVGAWEQDPDGTGLWSRTLSLLQFRRPRPALVKPDEGIPGTGISVVPVDIEELQIKANARAIDGLSGRDTTAEFIGSGR